jgi:hypothetical protein
VDTGKNRLSLRGDNFDRLAAVAKARDYRPEWIERHITRELSDRESEILQRMIAEAGPFLSRRCRWIMRQIRVKPMTAEELETMAISAPEYRDLKQIGRTIHHVPWPDRTRPRA